MIPFKLDEPRSLQEAIGLLDPEDPAVRPFAGGTAIMLMMKAGVFRPSRIVSLRSIERRFFEIGVTEDGEIRIGAMATLSELERSPVVRRDLPAVAAALRTLSNVRVRNVATLGGHLAHADPHMDLPPLLVALGASVTAAGPAGERMIVADELFSGYYETVLAGDELITEVRVPAQGRRRAAYLKCTTRSVDDWPAVGVAVSVDVGDGVIRDASIVVSAATEKPTRLSGLEALLRGTPAGDALQARVREAAGDEVSVIADARGSAPYKRELVRVYVVRAIRQCLAIQ